MWYGGSGVARLSSWLFASLVKAFSFMSLPAQRRLGCWFGRLVWYLRLDAARTTQVNLGLCFPELDGAARRRLARRSLEHTAMLFTESGALFHWPERRWRALTVELHGEELLSPRSQTHLQTSSPTGSPTQSRQSGLLILAPHFGNWEYLALVLGRYGVTALYDRPRVAALEAPMRAARNRAGATLLPIDAGGLRGFYRALATGGVTALLPDQVPERQAGVYAPFFGQQALTMTFTHRLLQRTRARVVLAAARRVRGGFSVRFWRIDETRLRDPDPAVSAAALNEAIEALVRTDPAQYQWEYKRFKRQPRGTPDPYARH